MNSSKSNPGRTALDAAVDAVRIAYDDARDAYDAYDAALAARDAATAARDAAFDAAVDAVRIAYDDARAALADRTTARTAYNAATTAKTHEIHFFKTENLTPDEMNAKRAGASGLWLCGGRIEAKSGRAACAAYRKSREIGCDAKKLRAK